MEEKEHSPSFERFNSLDAMYPASYKICRNVRWKDSTIDFEEHRLERIMDAQDALDDGTYGQIPFSCFSIIERGKPRDIRACHINDRMVQNALCETVLLPQLTPRFVYDNCATLKDKGIDFALNRLKIQLQKANREYQKDFFGLRIDIRKYFDSIDHKALNKMIDTVIKEPDVRFVAHYLVSTFSYKITHDTQPIPGKNYFVTHKGKFIPYKGKAFKPKYKYYEYEEKSLGLGSQSSQLFALLALNGLDHYIKEQLHIKYFGRYMDDIYLLSDSSEYLCECKNKIGEKLAEVGLSFNPNKTIISRIHPIEADGKRQAPFKFLKWNFYITKSGHVIQIPFKKKLSQQRSKLKKMSVLWKKGKISTEDVQASYAGWRANMARGTTFYIVQDMDNYFKSLFKGVEIT